jgi:hypothetical protein
MKGFILGIIVTLAVLYPAVTKNLLAQAVDTTNHAVNGSSRPKSLILANQI